MKLLVDTKKFYESIVNSEDRKKFNQYFSGNRTFESMSLMQVTLPEAKTLTQNSTIWRDFTIVSKLLYCEPSYIYYLCLKAKPLQDIWLKKDENDKYVFTTLSGLSKEDMIEAIPQIRDYLQKLANDQYGGWVVINWSCQENIDKPDYELNK